jgi:hypothetical protein
VNDQRVDVAASTAATCLPSVVNTLAMLNALAF